jgi:GNAT superfamily N-acetyltransferase
MLRVMTGSLGLEILGYAASVLIATSLMMRSIVRLRIFNLAGAATFSIYGFLIGAIPVGVLNLLTASINIVQLIRLRRRREIFRILEVRPEAQYLNYFLEFQKDDIRRFFPTFRVGRDEAREGDRIALFVLRDLVPAGVLLGTIRDGRLEIELDYVVPQYRDLKIGQFLFRDEAEFFRRRGVREILCPAYSGIHEGYLRRIGFVPLEAGRTYRLSLE